MLKLKRLFCLTFLPKPNTTHSNKPSHVELGASFYLYPVPPFSLLLHSAATSRIMLKKSQRSAASCNLLFNDLFVVSLLYEDKTPLEK